MLSSRVQKRLHKPESWILSDHSINTFALALKSGISIPSSDVKDDASLHISPEGVHVGGSMKVIIVSFSAAARQEFSQLTTCQI
jgi:hypothetical protein